ncbi:MULTISPECIES: jacalin-like lectin [Mameliella]|uniref:jacalin-like lectin n=1 Tax=Mameliella TaxID=1434019 RepID=UPI000B52B951|nr:MULTISPECIES: hypothetical protein [Mameliella]MCR9271653.1 hypothetical protein [Paracoccaceae bacterium]OWV60903.1 hypothetical protein CDZ98_07605 [Mameliella alba]
MFHLRYLFLACFMCLAATMSQACDEWFLEKKAVAGGSGGNPHFDVMCDGSRVSEIQLWLRHGYVTGLKVRWSKQDADGVFNTTQEKSYGSTNGFATQQILFDPNELITGLTVYPNQNPRRVKQIVFQTSMDRKVSLGVTAGIADGKADANVGTGYPVGVWVRSGTEIDSFGLAFIREPERINLNVDTYPTLKDARPKLKNMTPVCVPVRRNEETTVKLSETRKHVDISKWDWRVGLKLGFKYSGKAGVPSVGETGFEVSAEASFGLGHEWQDNNERTLVAEMTKKIPASTYEDFKAAGRLDSFTEVDENGEPLLNVLVVPSYYEANLDLPYKGTMELVYRDQKKLSWPVSGTYTGVLASTVNITERYVNVCPTNVQN